VPRKTPRTRNISFHCLRGVFLGTVALRLFELRWRLRAPFLAGSIFIITRLFDYIIVEVILQLRQIFFN
jgi:hypothetical protein